MDFLKIHSRLLSVEDHGKIHYSRCIEISQMINHIIKIKKKIEFDYVLIICTLQSYINSKKMVTFQRINWMLNSPFLVLDNRTINKIKKMHNNLFEDKRIPPHFFKVNSFKFEYSINFISEYLNSPIWFKHYILNISKIIFSPKKLNHEKQSKKSLRKNLLKINFLKKKIRFKKGEKNKNILLFKLFYNEGKFLYIKNIDFDKLCDAFYIVPNNHKY